MRCAAGLPSVGRVATLRRWAGWCLCVSSTVWVLLASMSPPAVAAGEKQPGLLATIQVEDLPFEEVEISDDLVVYYHQRTLGAATVELDDIVYQFSRTTGALLARKSHWREDLPDTLPAIGLTADEAAALVGGKVESTRLLLISPDSDVFPLRPVPQDPCWIVTTRESPGIVRSVVDAVTGEYLGEGVPPPTLGFALTGPYDFNPCSGSWGQWSYNAALWFTRMGYPAESITWPTEDEVAAQVASDDALLFYELAHGWYGGFASGCGDDGWGEETTPDEVAAWISGSRPKLLAFLGSCDGMCETGPGTLSHEFRKGLSTNTTTVGYCGMSTPACDDCWGRSLSWQDDLFYFISLGHTTLEAFNLANADFPVCAQSACMRFAGDEQYSLLLTEGACCVGVACQVSSGEDCAAIGGVWFPSIESCDPDPCTVHPCCTGTTCQILNWFECTHLGGEQLTVYEDCTPNPCLRGACCLGDSCVRTNTPDCESAGGVWYADLACDPFPCVEYACCLGDSCQLLVYDACLDAGGELFEGIETCDPYPCAPRACCTGEICQLNTLSVCNAIGGLWLPDHDACDPYICLADSTRLFDGMLIVHAPSGLVYSSGEDYCGRYASEFAISNSYEQVSRIDPASPEVSTVWYVLGAWGSEKEWCRTIFGMDAYDPAIYLFADWGPCNGAGVEVSSSGWPGPGAGTAVVHGDRWVGNYEPVYWFAGYAYGAGQIPLGAYDYQSQSGFGNCRDVSFPISCYGALGIYADGMECHPLGQSFACCTGSDCQILTEEQCAAGGGSWLPGNSSCNPDPCVGSTVPMPQPEMPSTLILEESAPNPFGSGTRIVFGIPVAPAGSPVRLGVYDASGRLIRTLVDEPLPAGQYEATWDGTDEQQRVAETGVYFCRLSVGGQTVTKRLLYLK
jgi:hypothetical protein